MHLYIAALPWYNINVDILLLFLTIFICYKTKMHDNRHIVDEIYMHLFKLIYSSYEYTSTYIDMHQMEIKSFHS